MRSVLAFSWANKCPGKMAGAASTLPAITAFFKNSRREEKACELVADGDDVDFM